VQLAKVGITNLPHDLKVVPFAFASVAQWMAFHGLRENTEFKRFLDASLLISAQSTTDYVYALYGATALDLSRKGVYHVEGGIGGIAETLAKKLTDLGGRLHLRHFVQHIQVSNGRATGIAYTQGRRYSKTTFVEGDIVILNNTPWALDNLLGDHSPASIKAEVKRRNATQGAFVLHLGIRGDALPKDIPDHHQIVDSLTGQMGEGHTVFVSMSPEWDTTRAPNGYRAVTVSTHTQVQRWWDLLNSDKAAYDAEKQRYAERMIGLIDSKISGFKSAVELVLPGSPVTYEFYTLRPQGMVGGFPQHSLFRARSPRTGIPNVRLVGDSVFPGQSTAGVTLGAMRVAEDILHSFPLPQRRTMFSPSKGSL
jgi:phytoene dehydrogenase-like protein